ncbi:hypothetical protein SAMN06298216_3604 [Spirosomataceae bacterium TFI 002]|nr:hypothetical protein SAMN06298216_3604 [Spirosomataceae bacterium TFI 002]
MLRYFLFFIMCPLGLFAQTSITSLNINTKNYNQIELHVLEGEIYDVKTLGKDPYLFINPLIVDLKKENNRLSFEYFCPTGVDFIQVHFYPANDLLKPNTVRDIGSTEGWVQFSIDLTEELKNWGKKGDYLRLDFGEAPELNIQLKNLVLREQTKRELEIQTNKEAKKQQELIYENGLTAYLNKDFPNQISNVLVNDEHVRIEGEVSASKDLFLAEIGVYENGTELQNFEFLEPINPKNKFFDIKLKRFVTRHGYKQDRLLSKWMIVEKEDSKYKGVSHARYTDSVGPKYNYPFVKPSTIKGLGGYSINRQAPYTDLDSLGITSATVNIWVTKFFRSGPSPENMPFEYMGNTYYVDKKEIELQDKTFLSTSERNIEVSAILLVDKASKAADKEIGRILQHPDCDPSGIYSMPNLTTPEGVQYYAAVLDFLANRYMRADKKYGRIHHWIIHNEVDAGWVWTNAGEKTALVFMDIYHKSMRMTHNIARKYNANSKVFITLTHYWNWTSNPHFYHSKELLEQLLQFSKAEGDFEWAIAQHPYPESLREPKTWLDNKVSFDFDTQLITFKNTEVLDAWVKQPEVLFKGKTKRLVYLSENGTNSPTYSEQDLKEQAAGMAYAMKKIKYLDGFDGFQYHNWQDNRREGGLRIGLRRFPDDEEDPSGIKPVWKVYQAFGTEKEDEVYDQYKEMIGIESWDEVRYKGEIGKKKLKSSTNIVNRNWTATDALGRKLPNFREVGPPKKNRYVGIFYFMTHNNSENSGPFNVTQILKGNPKNPQWGNGSHYWGEPEIGYYLNHEEWAIRRHANQLTDAGIDVIILDVTNNKTYPDTYLKICKVFSKMRNDGELTPFITFLGSEISVNKLWEEFYSKGLYKDIWFQWKGKPLLLYGQHELPQRNRVNDIDFSKEIKAFFNLRQSWAWTTLPWYDQKGKDEWPWVDHFPQAVAWHEYPTEKEMIPVAVAEHPLSNIGRSFHNFHQPETNELDVTPDTDKGLFFQEQWDRALEVDPEFVFVTGWNEWSAGKQKMSKNISMELQKWSFYPGAHLGKIGKELKEGDVYFIDQYNQEYSRDIEPMKGGHSDNYYYQLMANVRRFKGVEKPVDPGLKKTIDISGSFEQWVKVSTSYIDNLGDTEHRHSLKQGSAGPYLNTQGRNDILESKVVRDDQYVYFYIRTKDKVSNPEKENWMLLLIDSDLDKSTGWEGYDLLINHDGIKKGSTTIKKFNPKRGWEKSQTSSFRMSENELMLAIPRSLLEKNGTLNFGFHWVDNPPKLQSIHNLFEAGDNAPNRRANYQYTE